MNNKNEKKKRKPPTITPLYTCLPSQLILFLLFPSADLIIIS
jgi:hypothetical protein